MIQNTISSTGYLAPNATITVNRNRLKTYGNAVYMKSGTNFEIELYSPLQNRVMATIEIDGKLISSTGLVINPGQRVYLERWIDESRKFKFSTYSVENTQETRNAIASNGRVKVSFFEEVNKYMFPTWNNTGVIYTNNGTGQPYYYNNTVTNGNGNFTLTSGSSAFYSSVNSNMAGSLGARGIQGSPGTDGVAGESATKSLSLETGRAQRGESSGQGLESTSGDFNSWPTATVELQILPESQKPVEVEKIRSYCTECGTRTRSSSWKFCPACGEKL